MTLEKECANKALELKNVSKAFRVIQAQVAKDRSNER